MLPPPAAAGATAAAVPPELTPAAATAGAPKLNAPAVDPGAAAGGAAATGAPDTASLLAAPAGMDPDPPVLTVGFAPKLNIATHTKCSSEYHNQRARKKAIRGPHDD